MLSKLRTGRSGLLVLAIAAVFSVTTYSLTLASSSPQAPAVPPEKQAIIDAYASRQAAGLQHPGAKPGAAVPNAVPPPDGADRCGHSERWGQSRQ